MRAVKVLNNSLVLAIDENGNEKILMGKGIGYHKAIGYEFNADEIEKVFVLEDRALSRRIMRLAADTSSVWFALAKEIIDYAVSKYHMTLMDSIYLSLTDHLSYTAERMKNGLTLQNLYTVELQKFNPDEYDVGLYAVKRLEEETGEDVPAAEAGNIAWHFINAETSSPSQLQTYRIASTVDDILSIVKYTFGITYRKDTIAWSRYLIHVQLFSQRLVTHTLLPEEKDSPLFDQISETCRKEFAAVDRISAYAEANFHETLSNQEQMYLAIHFHRILQDVSLPEDDQTEEKSR